MSRIDHFPLQLPDVILSQMRTISSALKLGKGFTVRGSFPPTTDLPYPNLHNCSTPIMAKTRTMWLADAVACVSVAKAKSTCRQTKSGIQPSRSRRRLSVKTRTRLSQHSKLVSVQPLVLPLTPVFIKHQVPRNTPCEEAQTSAFVSSFEDSLHSLGSPSEEAATSAPIVCTLLMAYLKRLQPLLLCDLQKIVLTHITRYQLALLLRSQFRTLFSLPVKHCSLSGLLRYLPVADDTRTFLDKHVDVIRPLKTYHAENVLQLENDKELIFTGKMVHFSPSKSFLPFTKCGSFH
ncbi:hypothetical protein ISN45_Aa04g011410 [Arabidopsis thaliana x Arabidopsis arenosa]|uniref:Uncharacterized protein n=1 Tax=Arabidopsis thaliana x Arabidopsis arenosa TaxID=1240361 RepID=A0A8T2A8D8_9BRAS|nr:hypothetical protein ISN45_Aa04g011410 [Arabidopsis thaliana x Arabidopsis arenosa]